MSTYEVLYNSCYGGFSFPDDFIVEVFRRFPPESEEGKKLWEPTHDHFIAADAPIPVDKSTHRILKTEDFCHGYKWIYYERINNKGKADEYQSHIDKPSKYCTKDFATYYYVSDSYAREWRTLPGIITMARDCNLIHNKQNHTELRIAKVYVGYEFRIQEYDGMESVHVVCPTEKIIEDLLGVIRTGNHEGVNILTHRLLDDSASVRDVLYPPIEYDDDSE